MTSTAYVVRLFSATVDHALGILRLLASRLNLNMRRFSVLLACAALVLAGLVAYTYARRAEKERRQEPKPPARIDDRYDATATAWHWEKDDPQTNCPIVKAEASSFVALHDP